jgi:hypothetical protein
MFLPSHLIRALLWAVIAVARRHATLRGAL